MVAVEMSSTQIMGIAGQKNSDGGLTVLAYACEDASPCIKKGAVYNIDKAAQAVTSIVNKLEAALGADIAQVYVGIGGQSLFTMGTTVSRSFEADTRITASIVEEMVASARSSQPDGLEIIEVIPQEYKVSGGLHIDPVGVLGNHVEGRFLCVMARRGTLRRLESCFELAKTRVAGYFITSIEMARAVLSDAEMRSGCVLVDMGAGTTTVQVYKDRLLRHLAVIPLGGQSITRDISTLKMDEIDAEELKIKYARAYTDVSELDTHEQVQYPYGSDGAMVSDRLLSEIAEARQTEIIANVWNQVVLSGYAGSLMAGIVVTGGASGMAGLDQAFKANTGVEKFRVAPYVALPVESVVPEVLARNGRMCSLLALLASSRENCRVEEVPKSLFPEEVQDSTSAPEPVDEEDLLEKQKEEAARIAREKEEREAEDRAATAARIAQEKADREAEERAAAEAIAAAERKAAEAARRRERREKSLLGLIERFGRRLADDIWNGEDDENDRKRNSR